MENKISHRNSRSTLLIFSYLVALLSIAIGCMGITSMIAFVTNPSNGNAIYYGRVLSDLQLEAETGGVICGVIPLSEPRIVEQFLSKITGKPVFTCFDTPAELDEWMASMGLPH